MMSKYKTPIRIQLDTSRKINLMTHKYKLPFKSNVANLQRVYSVSRLQNQDIFQSENINNAPDSNKSIVNRNKSAQKSEPEEKDQLICQAQQCQNPIKDQGNVREIINTPIRQFQAIQPNQKTVSKTILHKKSKFKIQKSLELKIKSKLQNQSNLNSAKRSQNQSSVHRREQYSSSANKQTDEYSKNVVKLHQKNKNGKQISQNYDKKSPFLRKHLNRLYNASSSLRKNDVHQCEILSQSTEHRYEQNNSVKERVLKKLLKRSREKINQSDISNSSATTNKLTGIIKPRYEQPDDIYDHLPSVSQNSETSKLSKQLQKKLVRKLQQIVFALQSREKSNSSKFKDAYKEQYDLIQTYNPFFKKINQLGSNKILSIGKIKFLKPGDLLFNEGQPISHLSIIILGKVELSNSQNPKEHLKSFGQMGETLGQQALFDQSKPYHLRFSKHSNPMYYKFQAKAQNQVSILRINLRKFYKMCIELNMIGEKRLFTLIDNLFKVNYLKKKAILHQKFKERLKTEILGSLKKRGNSFYFY